MSKSVVIFLANGETLYFQNVTDFDVVSVGTRTSSITSDNYVLKFKYFGESTEVKRAAMFHSDKFMGYAVSTN